MWHQYASLAAQYYVNGRFAAQSGYVPLCGNLIHHAIELQLKCGLIKAGAVPPPPKPPLRQRLPRLLRNLMSRFGWVAQPTSDVDLFLARRYGHSLKRLWKDFKACHASAALAGFDPLIRSLQPWDEIRYPRQGIAMAVHRRSGQSAVAGTGPAMKGVKVYDLNIEDVDLFMQEMWSLMSISPEFFKSATQVDRIEVAASIYEDDNLHMMYA